MKRKYQHIQSEAERSLREDYNEDAATFSSHSLDSETEELDEQQII
jgi:hypothetical protein